MNKSLRAVKTKHTLTIESYVKEADWQKPLIELLQTYGYRVAHFRPGMTSREYTNKKGETKKVWTTPVSADGAGFPDIVAVKSSFPKKRRILFIELKSDIGKLSPEQEQWKLAIVAAGGEYYLARPSDYETLVEKLK